MDDRDFNTHSTKELESAPDTYVAGSDKVIMIDVSNNDIPKVDTISNFITKSGIDVVNEDKVYSTTVTVTLAELNAGKTLIAGVTGKKITVLGASILCTGAFGALTSAEIESTNGTPVVCVSFAQAQMTDGANLQVGVTGATIGAGMGQPLGSGDGVAITKTGSTATVATSLSATVTYKIKTA